MRQRIQETPCRDREAAALADPPVGLHEDEQAKVGTLLLMMLFLAAIAGLWGTFYWMLPSM